jgi:hypothetical protein
LITRDHGIGALTNNTRIRNQFTKVNGTYWEFSLGIGILDVKPAYIIYDYEREAMQGTKKRQMSRNFTDEKNER